MNLRSLSVILLVTMLSAGCAAKPTPAPPVPDQGSTSGRAEFAVKPAPNAVQRLTYNSVKDIPGPGLYVVDVTSGKVEAWQRTGAADSQQQFRLSDDRRWAVSESADQVYWANRQTGKVFGWNPRDVRLLATGAGQFLFAGSDKFYVTDSEFQPKYTFALDQAQGRDVLAQFAPDGKRVALNVSAATGPGHVYVADVTSGKSVDLGPAPSPLPGQLTGIELVDPAGKELVVSYIIQIMEPTGMATEQSIIRRYSWEGQQLGEFAVTGRARRISPDGRLLLSGETLAHLTEAAAVTDLSTGRARFRVLGAYGSQWTADGSRVILDGRNGSEYLVTTGGDLKAAPPIPQGQQRVFGAQLMPAPDDPHRFLWGLTVVDDSGKALYTVQLPSRSDWLIHSGVWGVSANELVFSITPPMGKGSIGFDFPLPPRVQKPPFPTLYLLRVQDPKGECVNLRESYTRSSRVIRCLPTDTKLAVADLAQAPEKLNAAWIYGDGQIWLWARTEQGETGWVSLSSGSVTWLQ